MLNRTTTTYRPDIDGLRALAVVPVMLFHFHVAHLAKGGFVGVDVFFVISGFLITKILHHENQDGTYSIATFYGRRVRRILPALFAMLAFCLAATFFTGFPSDVTELSHTIVASVASVSNVVFYQSSGYFDAKIAHNPLLHTWSLSVEEQFYIFFPLIMMALRKRLQRTRVAVIGVIAVASLVWAAAMVRTNPSAAFFLMPSRAWELMVGALLAIGAVPVFSKRIAADTSAMLGAALVVGSIQLMSPMTPFPGIAALAPCIGAALIIHAGSQYETLVSRLLSSRVPRFIGLISYSLYLWHWPIYVFYSDVFHAPIQLEKPLLIVVCICVAWASYVYVETPFRKVHSSCRKSIASAVSAAILLCGVAVTTASANEYLVKLPETVGHVLAFSSYDSSTFMRDGTCFLTSGTDGKRLYDEGDCLRITPGKINALLIGDSHAADLWAGFSQARPDVNFLQASASGCKPVLHSVGAARCTTLMQSTLERFIPAHHLDVVILSAKWVASDAPAAQATAQYLSRYTAKVIVIGPTAEFDQIVPRLLAKELYKNNQEIAMRHLQPDQQGIDRVFSSTVGGKNIRYVSAYQALCSDDCRVWANRSTPMYFDEDHLTQPGAMVLAKAVDAEVFGRIAGRPIVPASISAETK